MDHLSVGFNNPASKDVFGIVNVVVVTSGIDSVLGIPTRGVDTLDYSD